MEAKIAANTEVASDDADEALTEPQKAVLHELARLHRQHGSAYALEGIRILVYLNGGALAGIPIATQAFDALEIPFPALVLASAIFAAGLLAAGLVCLFAYFTEDTLALAYDNRAFGYDEDAQAEIKKHPWFRGPAIGLAILSWLLFVIAVAILFLSAQQKISVELSWDDARWGDKTLEEMGTVDDPSSP